VLCRYGKKSEKLPKFECNKADGTADNELYVRNWMLSQAPEPYFSYLKIKGNGCFSFDFTLPEFYGVP
jgi:hypothetical protein